jgi:hypothetical protein
LRPEESDAALQASQRRSLRQWQQEVPVELQVDVSWRKRDGCVVMMRPPTQPIIEFPSGTDFVQSKKN